MDQYDDDEAINIGSGEEISINELANIIKKVVGYEGNLIFDITKPNGNPRKLLDSSKIHNLGWRHQVSLQNGIEKTYNWFLQNIK